MSLKVDQIWLARGPLDDAPAQCGKDLVCHQNLAQCSPVTNSLHLPRLDLYQPGFAPDI